MLKGRVPNQRVITVNKAPCGGKNKYTLNNLDSLNEAAGRLVQKASFKLYIYIAKNQDKHSFNLSSSHFMKWANVGITAYNTAFNELVREGYLIQKEGTKVIYTFYDKSQNDNIVEIEFPKEKVNEIRNAKQNYESEQIHDDFVF